MLHWHLREGCCFRHKTHPGFNPRRSQVGRNCVLPRSFVGSAREYHTYTMTKELGENSYLGLVEGRGRVGVKLDWKISPW